MKLSFNDINLRESYLGLEIDSDSVKLVELVKRRKGLILKKWGNQSIEHSSLAANEEAAAQAIEKLKERLGINKGKVVARMNGVGVRQTMVRAPLMSYMETEQWLNKNISQFLPPGVHRKDIVFSFHICSENEQYQHILLAIARKNEVEKQIKSLEDAGLEVESLGAGYSDVLNALAFYGDDFYQSNIAVINVNQEQTTIMVCEKGLVSFYQEFDLSIPCKAKEDFYQSDRLINLEAININNSQQNAPVDLFQSWFLEVKQVLVDYWDKGLGEPSITKIILTGDSKQLLLLKKYLQSLADVEIGNPLKGILTNGHTVDAGFALCAGLAVKGCYPLLNTINLLPQEIKKSNAINKEKKKVLKIILIVGVIFLGLLMIFQIVDLYLNHQLAASEESLQGMNSRIVAIERLKQENERLAQEIQQARTIIVNRSHTSQLLWEISRLLPQKVWLREITIEKYQPDKLQEKNISDNSAMKNLSLTGLSFSEQQIAQFLKALEGSELLRNVRLIETSTLSEKEVYEKTKIRRVTLIRFVIECNIVEE